MACGHLILALVMPAPSTQEVGMAVRMAPPSQGQYLSTLGRAFRTVRLSSQEMGVAVGRPPPPPPPRDSTPVHLGNGCGRREGLLPTQGQYSEPACPLLQVSKIVGGLATMVK